MKIFIAVAAFFIVSCAAIPLGEDIDQSFELVQNEDGELFYLVPAETHSIQKRQTSGTYNSDGTLSLGHNQNLLNNQRHQLDGNAWASKNIQHHGPATIGGGLDYTHKPSSSSLSGTVDHTRGLGTNVGATGTYNFYQSKNGQTTAGASGHYSRHFGGAGGTGRPNYGASVGLTHRF